MEKLWRDHGFVATFALQMLGGTLLFILSQLSLAASTAVYVQSDTVGLSFQAYVGLQGFIGSYVLFFLSSVAFGTHSSQSRLWDVSVFLRANEPLQNFMRVTSGLALAVCAPLMACAGVTVFAWPVVYGVLFTEVALASMIVGLVFVLMGALLGHLAYAKLILNEGPVLVDPDAEDPAVITARIYGALTDEDAHRGMVKARAEENGRLDVIAHCYPQFTRPPGRA